MSEFNDLLEQWTKQAERIAEANAIASQAILDYLESEARAHKAVMDSAGEIIAVAQKCLEEVRQ